MYATSVYYTILPFANLVLAPSYPRQQAFLILFLFWYFPLQASDTNEGFVLPVNDLLELISSKGQDKHNLCQEVGVEWSGFVVRCTTIYWHSVGCAEKVSLFLARSFNQYPLSRRVQICRIMYGHPKSLFTDPDIKNLSGG